MVVSGPSGSGKTEWTRKLLLSNAVSPSPERIIWCFGQWQPLYDELQRRISCIDFVHGIPDYLNSSEYINTSERNLLVFDDLMTEAKCDQRIADLLTKGSHHRNIFIVYLTQNLFPQGKACRDIALNTQYLVLFNNPIDRQQVATLARRIYPSSSSIFMKRFEQATSRPHGYLVVDLKASILEQNRLRENIFDGNNFKKRKLSEDDNNYFSGDGQSTGNDDTDESASVVDDDDEDDDNESDTANMKKRPLFLGPPGKRRLLDLIEEQSRLVILEKRFKEPLRQSHIEQIKTAVDKYLDEDCAFEEARHLAANDVLPQLRKHLIQKYGQFLTDFYELQEDPTQQQILKSAKKLRREHDMNMTESIRRAISLRKGLFDTVWHDHAIKDDDPVQTDSVDYTIPDDE